MSSPWVYKKIPKAITTMRICASCASSRGASSWNSAARYTGWPRNADCCLGFRAANGVCLNPDGSFIVTDQEGHWNPKNRINWVREGGFYGNMFGYHDVTDSRDEAMEQPLCLDHQCLRSFSCRTLVADHPKWGPLYGQLLNLSYGYGRCIPFRWR